ncbi:histone deacetylase complex subunit SAP18-like protein, partial [Dimargaris cristalligena]
LAVDRQKSVPFLLRIFFNFEIHNPLSEYNQIDRLPENELQVYTWRDATLHELAQLIKEVLPEAREPGVSMQFNLIYPDALRGRYSVTTLSSVHNDRTGPGDNRTLADCRLVIGDFIDVSI